MARAHATRQSWDFSVTPYSGRCPQTGTLSRGLWRRGAGTLGARDFRATDCLKLALAVYPEANVSVTQAGLTCIRQRRRCQKRKPDGWELADAKVPRRDMDPHGSQPLQPKHAFARQLQTGEERSDRDRRAIEAAIQYMADEDASLVMSCAE